MLKNSNQPQIIFMKKVLVLLTALMVGTISFAQDSAMMKHQTTMAHHKMMNHSMKNCVVMEDGKMMVMKNGKSMAMDKDMTMSNGTMVMTDGNVKMKNGKTKMMKDGECIYMNGTMGKMSKKMDEKMEEKEKMEK